LDGTTYARMKAAALSSGILNPVTPFSDGSYSLSANSTMRNAPSSALWLATTAALNIGTSAAPSYIPKQIIAGPHMLRPRDLATTAYTYTGTALQVPWSAAYPVNEYFFADVIFPVGVTLTNISARVFGASSAGASTASNYLQLVRDDDEVTATTLATLYLAQGAGWQTASASVNQTVTSSQSFTLALVVSMTSGGTPQLGQTAIGYKMGAYHYGY
jgi:hypothetical protein